MLSLLKEARHDDEARWRRRSVFEFVCADSTGTLPRLTEPRKHINNTAFDKRRGLCFIRRGSHSVSAPANPLNYFHYLTKCSWQSGIAVADCAANGLCPFHKAPTAAATTPQTVFQSTPIFHWTGVATPAAYSYISDYLAFQSDSPISC